MHMNISYIDTCMCKLKKNIERRKELEREIEGLVVMVCVVVHYNSWLIQNIKQNKTYVNNFQNKTS